MGGVFNVGEFILPLEDVFDLNEYVVVAIDAVKDKGHVWGIPIYNRKSFNAFLQQESCENSA